MRPEQVIDMQADLLQRLTSDQLFQFYIRGVLERGQDQYGLLTPEERRQNEQAMRSSLVVGVKMGMAYRVTHDMSALVQHAASTLDDTDVFMSDLAPSEFGVVFFERPLPIQDMHGRTMLAHWLIWGRSVSETSPGRTSPVTTTFWFNDKQIEPDEIAVMLRADPTGGRVLDRVAGRWGFIGADVFTTGRTVGAATESPAPEIAAKIIAGGDTATEFTNPLRYLHALWMLLGQTVADVREEYIRRTAFRRAQRLGMQPRITVVQLRRSDGVRHDGESMIDWSHRWLVRGHPRWQPYGSRIGDHDHVYGQVEVESGHSVRYCQITDCDAKIARIWIAPFVKGPEGKPLLFRDHVYDLSR